MKVHVKLYANLRRYRPELGIGETFACDVPDDTTVAYLSGEVLGLAREEVAIVLVNGVQRDGGHRLRDGDQVALWSPIAGG
jgi:molybdopterin converting factor small subunit